MNKKKKMEQIPTTRIPMMTESTTEMKKRMEQTLMILIRMGTV